MLPGRFPGLPGQLAGRERVGGMEPSEFLSPQGSALSTCPCMQSFRGPFLAVRNRGLPMYLSPDSLNRPPAIHVAK